MPATCRRRRAPSRRATRAGRPRRPSVYVVRSRAAHSSASTPKVGLSLTGASCASHLPRRLMIGRRMSGLWMGCGTDPSRRCDPWSDAARPRLPAIAVHMRMIVCVIAPPLSPPCPFHSMAGARSAFCADRAPTPRPPQSRLVAMCRAAHSLARRPAPPELSLSVAWSVARSALVVVLRYEESEALPWLKKKSPKRARGVMWARA